MSTAIRAIINLFLPLIVHPFADKYDSTVEKFFGDEIMVLLGVPKAHEDDPVRAINVALEIHERVAEISPEFEKETGLALHTHTGEKYIGTGCQCL